MRQVVALALLVLAALATLAASDEGWQQQHDQEGLPPYDMPVRSSDQDEIKSLPGLDEAINFRQYSGYLHADKKGKKFFHYWFTESQNDPSKDPVLLWLNGGPGCSSLGGLFTELGPFEVDKDGKTVHLREKSWNKMANVLFLESPAGVGFSYSKKLNNIYSDDSTARENHLALRSFFAKFPHYKNNSLYLSGESYAGVYLPTLGVLVEADPEMKLKGIAIGNGYMDANVLYESLVYFSYYHGLAGKTAWDDLSKACCESRTPARESCTLRGPDVTWNCQVVFKAIIAKMYESGLNPYNMYADCAKPSAFELLNGEHKEHISRDMVDLALLRSGLSSNQRQQPFQVFKMDRENLRLTPPCMNDHEVVKYLNTPAVRAAIHIPDNLPDWDTCSTIHYIIKYPFKDGGLAPQMKNLINSPRNLTMLVYNGDVDTVCNFLGDEWFVDDLGRKVIKDYSNWHVDKQIAGYVKHYDGITFVTVRGSGHMVPQDRPREAFEMIRIFLNSTNHNVLL